MNKTLTLKYKKKFEHWLNGGSVLTGFRNLTSNQIKWYPSITNPSVETSTSSEILVIINDEYVEFRKALAEGKTIQCNAREDQNDITYAAFGNTWWVDTT